MQPVFSADDRSTTLVPDAASRPLFAIGDVHGMLAPLEAALAEIERAGGLPILLGDLVDKGPESSAVLRRVLPQVRDGRMAMVLGNHDEKLLKSLIDQPAWPSRTAVEIAAAADREVLATLCREVLSTAPYWIMLPGHLLVHGAFHPEMLTYSSGGVGPDVPRKLKALALYGETDGRRNDEGFPIRTYRWVDRIPAGLTVVVGHDTRSMEAPLVVEGAAGGTAVFLDTGAAKGGKLSVWRVG